MTQQAMRIRDIRRITALESRIAKLEAITGLGPQTPQYTEQILEIQRRVAEEFNIGTALLIGPSHLASIAYPRQIAMYLIYTLLDGISYPAVGDAFGGRHHTTVIHSVNKINDLRKSDATLNQLLVALSAEFHEKAESHAAD